MAQNDINTWGGAANSAATAFAPASSFTQAPAVYAQAGAPAPGAAQMTGRHKNPGRMPRTGGLHRPGARPSMSALARPARPAATMGDPMMATGSTPAIPGSEAPMGTPAPTMGAPMTITGSTPAIPGSEAPLGTPAPTMGGGFAALKQKLSQGNTGFSPGLGL